MKKILISLSLLLLLSLTSCETYLGIKPRGYEVAYKLEHYKGLVYGKEMYLLDETFPIMCFEYSTDADGYGNLYSVLGTSDANAYRWMDDIYREDQNCGEWNTFTDILYTLNIVINEVLDAEDGTEEERLAVQAEARVLRAYFTFVMSQFFSKPYNEATAATDLSVPIITEASTFGNSFPRRTMQEVYDFVTGEMEESLPSLEDHSAHHRRVFKGTGYALTGKVYWTMGQYDKALPYFETAYQSLFSYDNSGFLNYNAMINEEGEITNYPVDPKQNTELLYAFSSLYNLFLAMYPSYYSTLLVKLKTDILKTYFKGDDLRLAFISGMNSGKTAYKSFPEEEIYYTNLTKMSSNLGITIPDFILMYSECLARANDTEHAAALILEMRKNRMNEESAAIPEDIVTQDQLIQFIFSERVREFCGYGNLWFDMRRLWNDPLFQYLKEDYTHTDGTTTYTLTEKRLTMRIPPIILSWHPDYIDNE